jgi:hypothetical protein
MKPYVEASPRTEKIFSLPPVGCPSNCSASMTALQTLTAVLELGAGLALLCFPSTTVALLVGAPLEAPAAFTVARIGGAALLTLGVANWLARGDTQGRAARGLVAAMVIYNLGVAVILASAGLRSQPVGIALWPAVVLHAALMVWCVIVLSSKEPGNELRSSSGSGLLATKRQD